MYRNGNVDGRCVRAEVNDAHLGIVAARRGVSCSTWAEIEASASVAAIVYEARPPR